MAWLERRIRLKGLEEGESKDPLRKDYVELGYAGSSKAPPQLSNDFSCGGSHSVPLLPVTHHFSSKGNQRSSTNLHYIPSTKPTTTELHHIYTYLCQSSQCNRVGLSRSHSMPHLVSYLEISLERVMDTQKQPITSQLAHNAHQKTRTAFSIGSWPQTSAVLKCVSRGKTRNGGYGLRIHSEPDISSLKHMSSPHEV